jgi:hypothetical protein
MLLFFPGWGPPLTATDFLNGKKVAKRSITEETRQAIRAGIESHPGTTGIETDHVRKDKHIK